MAEEMLQQRFRRQLNCYPQVQQWLGDRLRRRAKADDWLRNRLVRAIVTGSDEAAQFDALLRLANPPHNRVDFFRGIFDGIPAAGVSSADFDFAVDNVFTQVAACALLQEWGLKPIRRLPEADQSADFLAAIGTTELIVKAVNLRRYARELYHLYDAVAAEILLRPNLSSAGLLVYADLQYLLARYEERIVWAEYSNQFAQMLNSRALGSTIEAALMGEPVALAEGSFALTATPEPGLHLRLLPPGEEVPASQHPLFLAARLEISSNVGWMHNHALAREFRASYLLYLDATSPAEGGLPAREEVDPLFHDYMALMWETNPKVSLHVQTNAGALDYAAPEH